MIANIEAESVVIAAMMIDANKIDRIADILQPEDFAEPLFGRIFRAARDCHYSGRASNSVAMNSMFEGDEQYEAAGGRKLIANLSGDARALIGAVDLAKQVADISRRRRVSEGLTEAIGMAEDQSVSLADTVEHVDTALAAASTSSTTLSQMSGSDCLGAMMQQLDSRDGGVNCRVIPPMDDLLGGARRKQLIILAARPGMGKTAVALSYSIGAAMNGHGVLYVSLEMSGAELGARMAADLCFNGQGGVPYAALINQRVNDADRERLKRAREMAADMPLEVIDASSL